MDSLSATSKNRLLLVGLGVITLGVLKWSYRLLEEYRDQAQVSKGDRKPQYINQATEDALKPQTLIKLIQSPNWGISETASRIVLDRSLHSDDALDELLWEVTRPDHDRRERGIRALHLLTESIYAIKQLDTPKVYSAIVKALEYCATDVPHDPYEQDFDAFDFRDACERRALSMVWRLSNEFTMSGFITAGFVPRWLAREPFGKTEKEAQENFAHLYRNTTMLSGIVTRVGYNTRGRKQLYKAKLISNPTSLFDDIIDTKMTNGESAEGETVEAASSNDPRLQEFSPEERSMRRRHRDAMVLNDGSHPVGNSDIIQREATP